MRSRTAEKITAFVVFVLMVAAVTWGTGVLLDELAKASAR
jgi:hypothetical protein